MTGSGATAAAPKKNSPVKRFAPLAVLVLAIALVFVFDLDRFVSFEALSDNRDRLLAFVDAHRLVAPLLFVLTYAAVIGLSIPGGAIMTIAGGFLFGLWFGALLVVIGATLGATMVFLVARTAFGETLREKAGPRVKRMEAGFRDDAFNYLLVLRLVPIFPFWLVNIVPALLDVGLKTYLLATFIGIIPGSFVYASVGNGLGAVFDAGQTPDLGIIFKPEIILPIIGLAILAIAPVVYKKLRGSAHK